MTNWIDQRPDDAMDGAFAAVAPSPVASVEPLLFREAMSRLGAAVHVVTTAGIAGKAGFTATAVCSVSDQPPTLLVCLNRRSASAPIIAKNAVFCVNTLGAAEEKLADLFAGRSDVHRAERFGVGEWTTLKTGAPVLASAVVAFDCRAVEIKAVGSHNVIFGAVEAVRLGPSGSALVYHDRAYKPV
ncbi:MAG: flavin reductase [Xanthobacteraceae bacterium]|jgi:flavin reductase (DIM6/NTAB) family NADH-FMN oxidoreductase RutF